MSQQPNRGYRGGHGGGGGGYRPGYEQQYQGHQHHRGGGRGGRGGVWQGGEGRGGGGGGGRGGYGRGGPPPPHVAMEGGGRGGGGAGGGGYQRSYIGGGNKRGREEGPEAGPPKLSPQHLLVAKLLGVCDRNTGSGRDSWPDERFFDDLLKSCRRDLEHGGEHVAGLLVEAAVEVSFKTQHYALVLGILNTERPDFSRRVSRAIIADLAECLSSPEPRRHRAKQLLRFLAALHAVNVVPADWLLGTLNDMVAAAAGALTTAAAAAAEHGHDTALMPLDDGGAEMVDANGAASGDGGSAAAAAVQPWSDFLVYSVLMALPWCGRDLAAAGSVGGGGGGLGMGGGGAEDEFGGGGSGELSLSGLLAAVESYMTSRPVTADDSLRPLSGSRHEGDLAAKSDSGGASFLGELWEAVAECRDNAWEVAVLPGPHTPYLEKLAAASPLEGLQRLEVPAWPPGLDPALPPALLAARVRSAYPPRGGLRLLSREYLQGELPDLERAIVEEYVLDTLTALSSDRTACVLTLSGALPHHLATVFGPQRATVRNFVAETLFSQMLRLPSPCLSHAAYCTLLVDLCKVPHFQFARALSSCVRELFGCMPHLDPELRFRLASWLSYHLSSFSFQWPWDRWQWVCERPPADPQRAFCTALLHRLLRLADYPLVKQSLPPYFQALLGPPPAAASPALPGNLAQHHPSHYQATVAAAAAAGGAGGGGGQAAGGRGGDRRRRGGGLSSGSGPDGDPDLLADDPMDTQQAPPQQQAEGPVGMQLDGGVATGAAGGEDGGGEAAAKTALAAPPVPWLGDPVAETAARLVVWCRQEGSAVAATTRARSLRPEQVAALWSAKVEDWLASEGGQILAEGGAGPLAGPQVLMTLILAQGVKSPSHLHVAVERYASAVRSATEAADTAVAASGEGAVLAVGSWEAAVASLGASPGQMAMVQVIRHYHHREPQRLLLVADRLLALHVLEGPPLVAGLLSDRPVPQGGRRGRRGPVVDGQEGEEPAAQRNELAEGEEQQQQEGGLEEEEEGVCPLSCFSDPVLSGGSWEVLLHVLDRLMRMPGELPEEVAAWEKKKTGLQAIHASVLASVAAGAPGLAQRERDVTAQVDQVSRCVEVVQARLERAPGLAEDALLLTYLGLVRLINRAECAAAAARTNMDEPAAAAAEATVIHLLAWVRSLLVRFAEPSASLLVSGRLRGELEAAAGALGGPAPESFRRVLRAQIGLSL